MQKIESNLFKLMDFGYLHQLARLATFCVNTQPNYFMGILEANHFRHSLVAFDEVLITFGLISSNFPTTSTKQIVKCTKAHSSNSA